MVMPIVLTTVLTILYLLVCGIPLYYLIKVAIKDIKNRRGWEFILKWNVFPLVCILSITGILFFLVDNTWDKTFRYIETKEEVRQHLNREEERLMETFIVISKTGEFGREKTPIGFGVEGTTSLEWTKDIHQATVFNKMSYRRIGYKEQVVHKLPAKEIRKVEILEETA